jgi:hypothetical protein
MNALAKKVSPFVLLGIGVAGATYVSLNNRKEKFVNTRNILKEKAMLFWPKQKPSACDSLLEKAGHPDPHDIGDNRMVDEGAMFSINYYNEKMHSSS